MTNVAIVGPFSRGIAFEVHAKGCADLSKARAKRHDPWFIDAESVQEIVEAVYGDHIAEAQGEVEAGYDIGSQFFTTWEGYTGDFKFLPCCPDLPEARPVAKPRRCYTIAELIERIADCDPLAEPGSPEWRENHTLVRMLNAAEAFEASR